MADVSGKFFSAKKVRTGVAPSSPGVEQGDIFPPVSPEVSGFVPYTGATENVDLGEFGVDAGFVNLDTTPTNTPTTQGTLYWDDARSTAALIMNGTLQHIGQDTFFYVKNSSGSSIPKGTAVRFNGTDGASGHLLIAPFLADGTYPSTYFMGVTAETIGNGSFGQVMHFGELSGINTSGFTAGALLYASTTVAGGFQTTAPVAPNNIVLIAAAINSKNNGEILVRPTYGSNINQDEGVKIVSAATGDLLQLQAGGLWENKTIDGAGIVTKATNQTITGIKTFSQDIIVNGVEIGRGSGNVSSNTSVGVNSLEANTTGSFNTSIGSETLNKNTTGFNNTAVGRVALRDNTTGNNNTAFGNLALYLNTTGSQNTGIGYSALGGITTGINNVAVGHIAGNLINSGADNMTSSNSVYLGHDTRASASGNSNEIVIGHEGRGNGSNTVTIGNSSITNNYFTGNIRGGAFIKSGGTSSQFLKADGSVDSTSYGTGTVTSVAALTLGTTGTDLSSTVANGTTTPVITLNVPTASATNRGALSAADWTTFNNKQNALTNPVTGTGTNNYLPRFTGTTTIGNSTIQTNLNGDLMVGSADAGDAGSINVSVGIAGSTSGGLQLWSNDLATHYIQFGDGTTGEQKYAGYVGYNHSTNAMVFGTDSGKKMSIFSDGNVSISNFPSNGGFKLDVNGTGRFIGNLTAASFIRSGGTSSQYLMADGSVSTLTNPVTGTGTAGQVAYWSSGSAITGESNLFWDATNDRLGISNASPTYTLEVNSGASQYVNARFYSSSHSLLMIESTTAARQAIFVHKSPTREWTVGLETNGDYIWYDNTAASHRMRLNTSGNLGLGVTPSAWGGSYIGLQVSNTGAFASNGSNGTVLGHNFYYNGTDDKYLTTGPASRVFQFNGGIRFDLASSGTAGSNLSFTQAMTLGTNSGLSIGTPSAAPAQGLLVQGASIFNGRLTVSNTIDSYAELTTSSAGADSLLGFSNTGDANSSWGIGRRNTGEFWIANYTGNFLSGTRTVPFQIASTGAATFSSSVTAGGLLTTAYESLGSSMGHFIINTSGSTLNNSSDIWFGTWGGSTIAGITNARISALNVNAGNAATDLLFYTYNGSSSGERMRITSGGDLQLNQTLSTIKTSANNSALILLVNPTLADNQTRIEMLGVNYSTANTIFYRGGTQVFTSSLASTEYMRITSGGNVLIGTTTDVGFKLDVNGTGRFSGNTWMQSDLRFGADFAGSNTAIIKWQGSGASIANSLGLFTWADARDIQIGGKDVYFGAEGGAIRMRITSGGNVLIGTTTNGASKLKISGLPTSSAGLTAGDVWSDSGTLKIA
jgi:hypothetical protein